MNVLVFWEEGFPSVDTVPLSMESLRSALGARAEVRFAGLDDLPSALSDRPDLLVTPYGSAFPKSAWPAMVAYLRAGGNWLNLGGAPATRPVRAVPTGGGASRWHTEPPQVAYLRALQLNHAFCIDIPADAALRCPPPDAALEAYIHRLRPHRAWALQPRFATTRDFPQEIGSAGPREAVLRPLVLAESEGHALAAPVVAIDWTSGQFTGGRWVLATCEGALAFGPDLVRRLCEYAVRSRATVDVRPSFACYYPGEMAALTVQVRPSFTGDVRINLRVFSQDTQREAYAHLFRAHVGSAPAIVHTSPFPVPDPGLYIARASVEANGHSKPVAAAETGFWVYDRELMVSGTPVSIGADGDLFARGGKPFPVTGTTYMAGDAQRKFLFEPNPAVWDVDMAAMAASGANMLRTGLWTGWRQAMLDAGAVDEGVLRAFAAFLLTARRHDLPVIFTFFAFLPDAWGGENPYLDPRSVAAQMAFVTAFARRFADASTLWWDLINEPSFCSPEHVWRCRPNYDRFERAAWAEWLASQGVSDDEWRERWGLTADEPLALPALADFGHGHVAQGASPLRVLDYRRFAQEMFAAWAARLRDAIRENGNPAQLVTVGQDEGGADERPNPWFHRDAVDFTANHSWWQNDDLLWDSVVAKTPGKPCLIEETGVMFGETPAGAPLWTASAARDLLELKMALAFAAGCAGFIQWQWNTNVTMASDIEAGIGLLRADGAEKPEMDAFRRVAAFFRANAHHMIARRPEDVVVVLPHSHMLGPRDMATAATRRAVRTLEYELGLPCRSVGEYRTDLLGDARLVVLPSATVLSQDCWEALVAAMAAGATVLATGSIEADPYGHRVPRLAAHGLEAVVVPVCQTETLRLPTGEVLDCRLGGGVAGRALKAVVAGGNVADCRILSHGEGKLVYCPLPVELSDDRSAAVAVYRVAAEAAGLAPAQPPNRGLLVRPVEFADATLYLLVNEGSVDLPAPALGWQAPFGLRVPAGRMAMAFVDRASGAPVSSYEVT